MTKLELLNEQITNCSRCDRLVEHRNQIAQIKRRAYRDCDYWGRPVPGFGDPNARILVVGLAPAAHGANRTGRMFTGDRSGDFLYRALYLSGFASQPTSTGPDDGLKLKDVYITAAARCAPPENKPLPEEFAACRQWLEQEVDLFTNVKVIIALGRLALDAYLSVLLGQGKIKRRGAFPFGHNRMHRTGPDQPILLCSFHPSQQNTQTGRLTMPMLLDVLNSAKEALALSCNAAAVSDVSYL